jgi:hypothetical protein
MFYFVAISFSGSASGLTNPSGTLIWLCDRSPPGIFEIFGEDLFERGLRGLCFEMDPFILEGVSGPGLLFCIYVSAGSLGFENESQLEDGP